MVQVHQTTPRTTIRAITLDMAGLLPLRLQTCLGRRIQRRKAPTHHVEHLRQVRAETLGSSIRTATADTIMSSFPKFLPILRDERILLAAREKFNGAVLSFNFDALREVRMHELQLLPR